MTKNGFFCWKIIRSNCPIGHTDTNIDFASKNDSEKHIFSNLVEEIRKNGFGYFLKVFLCLLVLDRSLDKWWSYWCYCYWHQLMKGSVWKRFWNMSSRLFCAINAKPSCQWWLPPQIHWLFQFATGCKWEKDPYNFHWQRLFRCSNSGSFITNLSLLNHHGYIKLTSLSVKVLWMLLPINNQSRIEKVYESVVTR